MCDYERVIERARERERERAANLFKRESTGQRVSKAPKLILARKFQSSLFFEKYLCISG